MRWKRDSSNVIWQQQEIDFRKGHSSAAATPSLRRGAISSSRWPLDPSISNFDTIRLEEKK